MYEAQKRYRQRHPNKVKKWAKRWRKRNPEKVKEIKARANRKYYYKNRQKMLERSRKWRKEKRKDPEWVEKERLRKLEYRRKKRQSKRKRTYKLRITPTLRFQVLSRDNFTCQYCGRKPPEVRLEVDHKDPRANGGSHKKENLTTACVDCNQGKKDKLL